MPHNSIDSIVKALQVECSLLPVVASEIEFYLCGGAPQPDHWAELFALCADNAIPIQKYEQEKGAGQYEVALHPTDANACATQTKSVKQLIRSLFSKYNINADFAAKPFVDQPGSGLHIHVHLEDGSGKNVYYKKDEIISDSLKFSIGGLLETLPANMKIFAPYPESYARFAPKSNAPLTVSWGANNRTVAIRLPDSAPENKHIEHRVAGADADPEAVIVAVLSGIHHGLTHKISPPPQIYGDASLEMYALPRLPQALEQA